MKFYIPFLFGFFLSFNAQTMEKVILSDANAKDIEFIALSQQLQQLEKFYEELQKKMKICVNKGKFFDPNDTQPLDYCAGEYDALPDADGCVETAHTRCNVKGKIYRPLLDLSAASLVGLDCDPTSANFDCEACQNTMADEDGCSYFSVIELLASQTPDIVSAGQTVTYDFCTVANMEYLQEKPNFLQKMSSWLPIFKPAEYSCHVDTIGDRTWRISGHGRDARRNECQANCYNLQTGN